MKKNQMYARNILFFFKFRNLLLNTTVCHLYKCVRTGPDRRYPNKTICTRTSFGFSWNRLQVHVCGIKNSACQSCWLMRKGIKKLITPNQLWTRMGPNITIYYPSMKLESTAKEYRLQIYMNTYIQMSLWSFAVFDNWLHIHLLRSLHT